MVKSQRIDSFFKRIVTQKDEERLASESEPGKCLENLRIEENEKQLSDVSRVEYDEFEKDPREEVSDQDGDDENSLEERNDSQLCGSVNDYINKPLELLGGEESDGPVPLHVADDMVEDDISSRAADLSVTNLGVEATSDATVRFSVFRNRQIDFSEFRIDPSKYKFAVLSFLDAFEDLFPYLRNPD
ncbi:hypothetical protein P8452_40046 [Trifolium repens]|nr:hypothetical protein P8452_40046 [Trifolium repens]